MYFSFVSFKSSPAEQWSKQCDCKCLVDKHYETWVAAHLKLFTDPTGERHTEKAQPTLFVYYFLNQQYLEWCIDTENISCLYQLRHASRPFTLSILAYEDDDTQSAKQVEGGGTAAAVASCVHNSNDIQQKVVLQFESEKQLREWMTVLALSSSTSSDNTCADDGFQTIVTSVLGEYFVFRMYIQNKKRRYIYFVFICPMFGQ